MNVLVILLLARPTMAALVRLDLNGTRLTVAVNRVFPHCDYSDELTSTGETTFRPSFELNYLRILKEKFNFRVKLLDMNRNFGKEVNGTWDGLIGTVVNRNADIGMCILSITYERSRVVDFTHHTRIESIILLSYAPGPKNQDWIISIPFTATVWMLTGTSLIFLSLIRYLLQEPKTFVDLVLRHFAISTRQSIQFKKDVSLVSQLLYFLWIVTSLILGTGYISVLHSILTLTEYEEPLDTQEQLVQALTSDKVIPRIVASTFLQTYTDSAQKNGSQIYFEIKQNMIRNKVGHIRGTNKLSAELVQWRNSKPPVFFASNLYANMLKIALKGYLELYISKENIFYSYIGVALPKQSPLIPYFSKVIQRLAESGIPDYWLHKIETYYSSRFKQDRVGFFASIFGQRFDGLASKDEVTHSKQDASRELLLSKLQSIFLTWFIGLTLSLIVFVFEVLAVILLNVIQAD